MTNSRLAAQINGIKAYIKTLTDFGASMHRIREIGYTAVQIDTPHITPGVPLDCAEIKRLVDEAGLTICNTHIPWEKLVADIEGTISQHQLWECEHVAIPSLPIERRTQGEEGYRLFAAEASQFGQQLAEAGLTLSYHNHSFELARFGSQTGLEIIFDESNPPYLSAEIDTYWIQHGGGDPADWIRKMSSRIPVVHFKDMVILEDGSQAFAEVGEGNLNWPAILAATEESQVSWIVVEQDVCQRDPFESLQISYHNLLEMGLI